MTGDEMCCFIDAAYEAIRRVERSRFFRDPPRSCINVHLGCRRVENLGCHALLRRVRLLTAFRMRIFTSFTSSVRPSPRSS